MATMYVTVGVSGSGKTTWAESVIKERPVGSIVNINRDDLRKVVYSDLNDGAEFSWEAWRSDIDLPNLEDTVSDIQREMISINLKKGVDIIISDTNLKEVGRNTLKKIAEAYGYLFKIVYFHVCWHDAVNNDANRLNKGLVVGKKVLELQFRTLHDECKDIILDHFRTQLESEWEWRNSQSTRLIVVDIDGTVASMNGRTPHEYDKVGTDLPRDTVIQIVTTLSRWSNTEIVFLTGRPFSAYEETTEWLKTHIPFKYECLLTRDNGDYRPDWVIKLEKMLQLSYLYKKPYVMFDDRNQVVEVMREMGIEVFQVANGDF